MKTEHPGYRQTVCTYFDTPGAENTDMTLQLARERAQELGIRHIVVASTSGATGLKALDVFADYDLVIVSHSSGFRAPNDQEMEADATAKIKASSAHLLTTTHAFGGIGRAVRRKLGAYEVDEIIAFTLRTFCEGTKVSCEISLMASDAGLIPAGEPVIAIGGTGHGADTALVLLPANAQDLFDLRVLEVICKPRCGGHTS